MPHSSNVGGAVHRAVLAKAALVDTFQATLFGTDRRGYECRLPILSALRVTGSATLLETLESQPGVTMTWTEVEGPYGSLYSTVSVPIQNVPTCGLQGLGFYFAIYNPTTAPLDGTIAVDAVAILGSEPPATTSTLPTLLTNEQ